MASEIWLIRHGESGWNASGRYTGTTDVCLTQTGIRQAEKLRPKLTGRNFDVILVSPLSRAVDTCRMAGLLDKAERCPDLRERSYGDLEGLTYAEAAAEYPDWRLWLDTPPGGESPADVAVRASRVLERAAAVEGRVALFGHGSHLRILTMCWLGLPPESARMLVMVPASVGVLARASGSPAILCWGA